MAILTTKYNSSTKFFSNCAESVLWQKKNGNHKRHKLQTHIFSERQKEMATFHSIKVDLGVHDEMNINGFSLRQAEL